MVLIPEKAVLLTPLKTKWPLWPNLAKYGFNITIFGEDNFTSHLYVKRGGNSRKSSLIDPLKTKWPFWLYYGQIWSYYGQIWPNMGSITIFGENNFTSQFLCKKG